MNKRLGVSTWVISLSIGMAACARPPMDVEFERPHYKKGVVIAESQMKPPSEGLAPYENMKDCDGPDVGVSVQSALGDKQFQFDSNGEPCDHAVTLFDGNNPADTRMPPPSMHIAFTDQLGSIPSTAKTMPRIEMGVAADPKTPEEFALGMAGTKPTHTEKQTGLSVEETVAKWKALRQNEKLFADLRDIERMSSGELINTQQDKILELQAKLDAAKRQQDETKLDGARLQADIERMRQQLEARGLNFEQKEGKMSAEMLTLKQRLAEYERRNQALAKAQEEKEAAYKERVAKLQTDLKAAEEQADSARREMVLKAAQKIAEAERLAFAARMAEKDALQREAARKKQESDMLLERALRMKEGKTVMVPGLSDKLGEARELKPLPLPLEKMPVNVHAEGQTLQALMDGLLKEIEPLAGNWRVSWQLSSRNKYLLDETWTLTAEADFGEVLAFITKRLQETHSVTLSFEQFDKIRLLVVSDGSSEPGIKPEQPAILR